MSGRIDFTMGFNTRGAAQKIDSDLKYRTYILGNFSGHSGVAWEQRKIRKIDIDTFDQVMAQIMPVVEIGPGSTVEFGTLDDFHPDAWLEKIQLLADLQTLKRELSNPNTAAQAAAKIQAFLPSAAKNETVIQQEGVESQEDMLERLLGKRPESIPGRTDSMDRLIERMVSPYVTKDVDPQHRAVINVIDLTINQYLQTLLHRPDFQTLEALWRATEALLNEEAADEHSFFLVDISRAELLAELKKDGRAFERELLQHIRAGDGEQDVLLICDYGFSDSADDIDLLAFCSRLAKACGGCFLGGADQALIANVICAPSGQAQNWTHYLEQICADSVVLAYPRYLLRLPYGTKRNPLEALAFEECSAIPQTDELLWGNPAFLCARAMIRNRQGQHGGEAGFFSDIPAFAFDRDGEQILQPGTESVLNEAQANALVSQGITPLIGFRQRQGVRVLPIATLSELS